MLTCHSQDYLNQKLLLQEFGWPSSFPLSLSNYLSLIRTQSDLYKERLKSWENRLDHKWLQLTRHWHEIKKTNFKDSTQTKEVETLKVLDEEIKNALTYHIKKIEDRRYALATDLPLDKRYNHALVLHPSTHSGSDWKVDVTPLMLVDRFNEVISMNETVTNFPETDKISQILNAAYERYLLSETGIHSRDYVSGDDDDETSDYVPSEEECSEEEEFETDEEDEELEFDIVMLEEDIKADIEDLRRRMEGFEIGQA
jgi:hypothetical protein